MLRSVESLYGYTVHASDGDAGKVREFYFDDENWTIRYLVVDTGTWLPGRKVLISPLFAIKRPEWQSQLFPIDLTTEQIKNSPEMSQDKPVSRQHQIALHKYYGWPAYWSPGVAAGSPPLNLVVTEMARENAVAASAEEKGNPHLRSTREVTGYHIQATDGEIGHVEDFIVNDESWVIRYMVVNTSNWLSGRKVLISPLWATKVSWNEARVHLDLSRDSIRNSPEYDPATPINQEYEMRLYDFYGRPKNWL